MQDKIVVIGGGIGGLAAALALLKRGLDVEIHEQAGELKEAGGGLPLSLPSRKRLSFRQASIPTLPGADLLRVLSTRRRIPHTDVLRNVAKVTLCDVLEMALLRQSLPFRLIGNSAKLTNRLPF